MNWLPVFRGTAGWMGFQLAVLVNFSVGADDHVAATLRIPPAERYVIGDDIPLIWSFSNRTATPLAFLWEGCCRLNGRLTVTSEGQVLPPIPPGSALAHQFARAERIEPGAVREFSTLLSDWVSLRSGGRYRLRGAYTGVLSNQQPQVPKSLSLWRGTAQAEDISVAVLTPEAYLAERAQREQRRGLRLELRGPPRLGPLEPTAMELTVSNLTAREQRLVWPGDVQVWILAADGLRADLSLRAIEAMTEELVLPPGGSAHRSFAFTASEFERLPLGDYRCFIDLTARGDDCPRLPSNAIPLRWRLEEEDVVSLLSAAARGGRTGARNAP
ncbi:MAG TPA: hypothetical protein VNO52_08110, partial [Methylomirabilota bacterium]|nr:hypothetical protein [Methylomirabilota bacterium]